jgi:hypothetical protein
VVTGEGPGASKLIIAQKLEKGSPIDVIQETNSGHQASLSTTKATTLLKVLQGGNTSKIVDENGEPLLISDNAGTYDPRNPSILFQDDAFIQSYRDAQIMQNPELIAYAASFRTWEDFKFDAELGWGKNPQGIPAGADDAWYQSVWESARGIAESREGVETGAGKTSTDHFLDFIGTDEGLDEIFTLIDAVEDSDGRALDEEDQRRMRAEKQAVDNVFSHWLWKNRPKNGVGPEVRQTLRGMVRANPAPYMNAYAVLSGDEIYLVDDDQADTLVSLAPEREAEIRNASPERLRRIAREIAFKGVEEDIANGTLRGDDPRIPEFEEENREQKKKLEAKIAYNKDAIVEHERVIKNITHSIIVEQKIQEYNSTREGLTKTKKDINKIKKLEAELLQDRREYSGFLSTLNATQRENARKLREVITQLRETEKNLETIKELREIRKKTIRRVIRRPDFKTLNVDEAVIIEGIQAYFSEWYDYIPRWIGPKAKSLRTLYNDFANNEGYREELRKKHSPAEYRAVERIMYADPEKKTLRPYPELTKAQRNKLYGALMENENLIQDLGLDRIDAPAQPPSAETRAKIRELLPADLISKLDEGDLAAWTLEDMEALGVVMSELRDKGRTELKIKRDARRNIISGYRDKFDRLVTGGKDLSPGGLPGVQSTRLKDSRRSGRRAFWYSLMNPRRFFRMLDGGKDQAFFEIIMQGEDRAYYDMSREVIRRRDQVDQALKAAKIDIKEL